MLLSAVLCSRCAMLLRVCLLVLYCVCTRMCNQLDELRQPSSYLHREAVVQHRSASKQLLLVITVYTGSSMYSDMTGCGRLFAPSYSAEQLLSVGVAFRPVILWPPGHHGQLRDTSECRNRLSPVQLSSAAVGRLQRAQQSVEPSLSCNLVL